MIYAAPGVQGAKIQYKAKYDNFIGGKWIAPVKGQYFDVITPINGKVYTQAARSSAEDIELALNVAHAAADKWGDKIPKTLRSPFRLNEELEAPIIGIGDDWTIMSFSASSLAVLFS